MIQETEKLFDKDAYAAEFSATVLSAVFVENNKKRFWKVILDRTLFFPEEGGQTPDIGTINGCRVVDVQLEGSVICHYVQRPSDESDEKEQESPASVSLKSDAPVTVFETGQTIHGIIDFAHRFSNMQNHSGEHILSGLVHGRFGYDNVGFHLSDNTVTLDFNGPLTDEDLLWLEKEANRVVWENKEIRGWYPEQEELEKAVYRSKKEIDGPLRLVEIPGVDLCACCAPHVRRTGEIGLIKIIRTLRERSGIRLTILCGSRALEYMQTLQKAAEEVSHLTNMPREEIAAGVSRILEDNNRLKQREAALENQVIEALAASVPTDRQDVFLFTAGAGSEDGSGIGNLAQRRLVNTLCAEHPGYCGVFTGSDGTGYKYIIGAGEDNPKSPASAGPQKGKADSSPENPGDTIENSRKDTGKSKGKNPENIGNTKDARVLNAVLHKACGARGGGKPAMVQGSVQATEEEIRSALEKALHEIAET